MLTGKVSIQHASSRSIAPAEESPEGKRLKLNPPEEESDDFSMYDDSSEPYMCCIKGTVYKNKARLILEQEIAEWEKLNDHLSPFDAIAPPRKAGLLGCVVPHPITDDLRPHLKYLCDLALHHSNNDKGTNLVFEDFVKYTRRVASGYVYYTTFQARDATESDSAIQTLQAEVWDRRLKAGGPVVLMCRTKPTYTLC